MIEYVSKTETDAKIVILEGNVDALITEMRAYSRFMDLGDLVDGDSVNALFRSSADSVADIVFLGFRNEPTNMAVLRSCPSLLSMVNI